MNLNPFDEIYYGFRANLPIAGLAFSEIQRLSVLGRIYREVAREKLSLPIIYWSYSRGFEYVHLDKSGRALLVDVPQVAEPYRIDLSVAGLDDQSCLEPSMALQKIMVCPVSAIFIMHGITEMLDDPRVKALFGRIWDSLALQEYKEVDPDTNQMVRKFGGVVKRLIVTGTNVAFPNGLRAHHPVYRVELPGRSDVTECLERTCQTLALRGYPTNLDDEQRRLLVANLAGAPQEQIENLLRKAAIAHEEIGPGAIALAGAERLRMLEQSKAEFIKPPTNDIAGLEVLMGWVRETLIPSITLRLTAANPGFIPERKGIILVGPPGTGKTLAAQAITKTLGIPGIKLDVASLMNSGLGDSENNLLEVLRIAKAIAPCVLFIDELDKAGFDGGAESDGGTTRRMLQTLLGFLSEDREKPIFVICTMNRLDKGVPPEFTRPGRFDEIFFVDLPNETERAAILAVHCGKRRHSLSEKDFRDIAAMTTGYSGADLAQLSINAWFNEMSHAGETDAEAIIVSRASIDRTLEARPVTPSAERFRKEIEAIREIASNAIPASAPDQPKKTRKTKSASAIDGMI